MAYLKKKAVLVSISKRILAAKVTVLDILLHVSIKRCIWKQAYLDKLSEQSLFTRSHFKKRIFQPQVEHKIRR